MSYNERFHTDKISIKRIYDDVIENRTLGLPIFQRPSVWNHTRKIDLLISVLNGHPIGSLLWVEVGRRDVDHYQPKSFESGPSLVRNEELKLVVDGQQRITAILDILTSQIKKQSSSSRRWALELNILKMLENKELNQQLFALKSGNAPSIDDQVKRGIMRAELLINPLMRGTWWTKFQEQQGWDDATLSRKVASLPPGLQHGIAEFVIPVITLTKENSLAEVLDYFEKLNTRGEALNSFDIAHSRMADKGGSGNKAYDLRTEVTEALASESALERLGIGPDSSDDLMLPLQLLAMRVMSPNQVLGAQPAEKTKDISNGSILVLPTDAITGGSTSKGLDVRTSIAMLAAAAQFLHENCGIASEKLLPQKSILLPLANELWAREAGQKSLSNLQLRRWFYCTCLQGEFHGRTQSTAIKHVKELHAWANSGELPSVVENTNADYISTKVDFAEQFTHQPKIQGIPALGMLIAKGVLDWSTSGTRVSDVSVVQLHHICPDSRLRDMGYKASERKCIANFTPISAAANGEASNKKPREVFDPVEWNPADRDKLLQSHLVDPKLYENSQTKAGYKRLIDARSKAMRNFVISELGL